MRESPLWHTASQAVKRKTCYYVGRTRTVTLPHVWPSTPRWGVERGIVKAEEAGPTHHCLQIHVQAETRDKRRLVCLVFEYERELGVRKHKGWKID